MIDPFNMRFVVRLRHFSQLTAVTTRYVNIVNKSAACQIRQIVLQIIMTKIILDSVQRVLCIFSTDVLSEKDSSVVVNYKLIPPK